LLNWVQKHYLEQLKVWVSYSAVFQQTIWFVAK
jgi:hypothetical protein